MQQQSRKQLAEQGQQQVLQLMRSGKQLLDSYSALQPTGDAQQQLQRVQEQYLKAATDIQATLQQCQALQQQEEAAATSAAGKCGDTAAGRVSHCTSPPRGLAKTGAHTPCSTQQQQLRPTGLALVVSAL